MNARNSLESTGQRTGRLAGLALLFLAIVAPMLWALGYSLLYSVGGIGLLSDGWTLRHWQSAFTTGDLAINATFGLLVAGVVTVLASVGALTIALAAPPARNRIWLPALLCIPLATPSAVSGLMSYYVLNPGGVVGRLAFHAGWISSPSEFPALVNDRWAVGIVIAQTVTALPLLALFFLGVWTTASIDRYCRLAESLGATRRQARLRVALPMLLKRGSPLILLVFLWQLGTYEIPLLLGQQSPQMFSVLLQRHVGQFNLEQRPEAFVLAVIYLLLAGAGLMLFLKRRTRRASSP